MSSYIILTVPHSYCEQHSVERMCDKRALEAAKMLSEKLTNVKVIVYGNKEIPRYECDMNRAVCRHTYYRQHLDKLVNEILTRGDKILWVLDMHSFPSYESWYSSINKNDYKLVFLYVGEFDEIFRPYFKSHPEVGFLEGSLYNDIMITNIQKGIKSILIESLEDHNLFTNDEMSKLFDIISRIVTN